MHIASCPDPEFPERRHEVLWLLTDERGDFRDEATAHYLGHDRDSEGYDLAGVRLRELAKDREFDLVEAEKALARYRSLIAPRTVVPRPHVAAGHAAR